MSLASRETENQNSERRKDRRYQIEVELEYRLVRRGKVVSTGRGHTVNVSTGGLLFESEHALPAGMEIELAIAWPARIDNVAALKLWVTGRTVRAQGNLTAAKIIHHHFRTAGTRKSLAAANPTMSRRLKKSAGDQGSEY
jgi:hypothetical protein